MDDATRLKRLRIRAWRRGIRELDLLLGPYADAQFADAQFADAQFADAQLADGQPAMPHLDAFERLLSENDTEVYDWFLERATPPEAYEVLLAQIRRFHAPR